MKVYKVDFEVQVQEHWGLPSVVLVWENYSSLFVVLVLGICMLALIILEAFFEIHSFCLLDFG